MLRRWLAVPDVVLFGWVGFAQPLVFAASAAPTDDLFGAARSLPLALVYLAAAIGAVVALVTRDAEAVDAAEPGELEYDLSLAGATSCGVLLVFVTGFDLVGTDTPEALIGIVFVAAFAGALLRRRLPAIPGGARRLLVTPFVVATAGIFDQLILTFAGLLDPRVITQIRTTDEATLLLTLGGIGVAVSGFFYVMLILAPRRLAGDRASGSAWLVRYAVFVVSVVIGLVVSALVG